MRLYGITWDEVGFDMAVKLLILKGKYCGLGWREITDDKDTASASNSLKSRMPIGFAAFLRSGVPAKIIRKTKLSNSLFVWFSQDVASTPVMPECLHNFSLDPLPWLWRATLFVSIVFICLFRRHYVCRCNTEIKVTFLGTNPANLVLFKVS